MTSSMLKLHKLMPLFDRRARNRVKRLSALHRRRFMFELLEDRRMLATWSGDIPNGTIWTNTEVQQIIGDARVPAGSTLTIQPGTIVKFNHFTYDLTVSGALNAIGTAQQNIVITDIREDVGGDTNGDGGASSPAPGGWGRIEVLAGGTATLHHTQIRYGGYPEGQLKVQGGMLNFTDGKIEKSSSGGLRIEKSNATITNVEFRNNLGAAASMDLASNPSVSGVTVTGNGVNAMIVDGGNLVGNGFWNDPEIVYRMTGAVTVPVGSTLTIGAGQIVKGRVYSGEDLVVNGTLNADGTTSQPIIFTSIQDDTAGGDTNNDGSASLPADGTVGVIKFSNTSTGNVMDFVDVRYGGYGYVASVIVDGGALSLTNSVLRNSGTSGLRIQKSNPALTSNTFRNNATAAISMDLASNPAISGVTVTGNGANALIVDGGNLVGNGFWNDPDMVYRLTGAVTVPVGSTLTIGAGQIVKGRVYSGEDLVVNGTLNADGTASQPIIFTSIQDDTAGGDTNNDGSASLPGDGTVGVIKFSNTSTGSVMDSVEVRYGGYGFVASVIVDGALLRLTNSVIRNSGTSGLRIQASNPTLTSNTFRGNATAAISMDLASNPSISGVTVTGNGANALIVDGGNLVGNGFWNDPDIVYRMTGAVTVPVGSTLTIGAGQIVKGRTYTGDDLLVNGTLIADGTPSQPIIFTSFEDDTAGGDTNNDFNASLPGNGTVGVIKFSNTSTRNVLDNVEVRYGGYGFAAAVIVDGGALSLTNSVVRNSGFAGLRVQGARPTVSSNIIEKNGGVAISINQTGDVAASGNTVIGNRTNAVVVDGGTMAANQTWSGRDLPYQLGGDLTVSAGVTLTLASGTVFEALDNFSLLGNGTVSNAGTILKSTAFTSTIAPLVVNTGTVKVLNGTVNLTGGVVDNGNGVLVGPINTTLAIGKNFAGDTQNLGSFAPLTTVLFNGTGTAGAPQLVEVLSGDKGNVGTGFDHNLAFYSLSLSNNTFVKLVDNSDNTPGSGAEAVYVSNLVTAAGTTLDLNGLHLYARSSRLNGTVIGGTVSILPDGGPLGFDTVTPGKISAAGEIDDWTIFGRAGQTLTITVSTSAGGTTPPVAPTVNFAQIKIFDASNNVLGTASNTTSGLDVTLAGITLPADGTYHIKLQAPTAQANSTGNYVITAWNATVNVAPLELGRTVNGTIDNPFRIDRWNFSASAGQAVKFNRVNAESSAIQFDLTGPNGLTLFSNASTSSGDIVLPNSGTYSLTVHSSQRQTGAYAFRVDQTTITDLTLGTPLDVSLVGGTHSQLFRVNVPQAQQMQITLTDNVSADRNEVYVKLGSAPTRSDYQYRFSTPASANQQVNVPSATPGNWYILVHTEAASQQGSMSLTATSASVYLTDVRPDQGGTNAVTTITLTGLGFDNTTTVNFVSVGNSVFPANSVRLDLPTQLTATFSAGTVPAGTYSVTVTLSSGASATLPGAFTFVAGGQANLVTNVIVPNPIGRHIAATIYVEYGNTGTIAMPAPFLVLSAQQNGKAGALLTLDSALVTAGFWTSATPKGYGQSVQLLASGATPGVLQPGESVTVPVYYAGWLASQWDLSDSGVEFSLGVLTEDNTAAADWASMKSSLKPAGLSNSAWDGIYPNLTAQLGPTWGNLVKRLNQDADYLGSLGEKVTDLAQLWAFELQQANGINPVQTLAAATDMAVQAVGLPLLIERSFASSIIGRNVTGHFGSGWSLSGGWGRSLAVQPDGTVGITDSNGVERVFQPDLRNGNYFAQTGDHGKLANQGSGVFTLTEPSGLLTRFQNGQVAFVQDTNGNRITAGYISSRLTSLTASSGQSITLTYNSSGHISDLASSLGQSAHYVYDPTNQYLLSATDLHGYTTTYSYYVGTVAPTNNALKSVTYPEGTEEQFSYDPLGRLSQISSPGGVQAIQFTYGVGGTLTVTNAMGDSSAYSYDNRGLVAKRVDPLQRSTFFAYDVTGNLTTVTNAAGTTHSYIYDSLGNRIQSTNPLGNSTRLTRGPRGTLTSATDPKGNTTQNLFDQNANLLSTLHADGTIETFEHDPLGLLLKSTDGNKNVIQHAYNSAGQLTSKTYAGGSQSIFGYDSLGNLRSVQDSTGTTTLSYDSASRPAQILFPDGKSLTYTYDTAGRRTQIVDQTGFTNNYTYTPLGQLAGLQDSSHNSIVSYSYDAAGRVSQESKGNNTFTRYSYNAAGEVRSVINHAPDGMVNSSFVYTYDILGLCTTETTLQGQWVYSYDAVGQLTHAVFASSNPGLVPNQDLHYFYDAAGNRTSTNINGVTTSYTVNVRNEYTMVGSTAYVYDPNGNLISQTDTTGTTDFNYNADNRLVAIQPPTATASSYQYDAFGGMYLATENVQATRFLTDPLIGNVVGQFTTGGAVLAHYSHGLGLINQVNATAASTYYDFDVRGSTAGLTNAAGAYVNTYAYLPFGGTLTAASTLVNAFQYVGQRGVMKVQGGFDVMGARLYDSVTGQFAQDDPIGLSGGDFNIRRYAINNPVSLIDPEGLDTIAVGPNFSIGALGGITLSLQLVWDFHSIPDIQFTRGAGTFTGIEGAASLGITYTDADSDSTLRGRSTQRGVSGGWGYTGGYDYIEGDGYTGHSISGGVGYGVDGHKFWTYTHSLKDFFRYVKEGIGWSSPAKTGGPSSATAAAGLAFIPLPNLPTTIQDIIRTIKAFFQDPNDKIGPAGFGTGGFIVNSGQPFPYRINFENDKTATAPAQRVTVTDQLNANLDWNTFTLSDVGFGDTLIHIPSGRQHFQTTVPITQNGKNFEVEIELGIHSVTGQVFATFQSIDPGTRLPPDVLTGFLPPEDETGRGQGHFSYIIEPKKNLATGTQIRNVAVIVFYPEPPITTDQIDPHDPSKGIDPGKQALNTIDAGSPTSNVLALPSQSGPSLTVNWSGTDDVGGSGIASYSVFVSDNNGPFVAFVTGSTATTAVYTGTDGHTYRFYSVATDNVGHVEAIPATFDTQTLVAAAPWQNSRFPNDVDNDTFMSPLDVLAIVNELNSPQYHTLQNARLVPRTNNALPFFDVDGDGLVSPLDVLIVINAINRGNSGGEGEAVPSPIQDDLFADSVWLDQWLDRSGELDAHHRRSGVRHRLASRPK